MIVIEKNNIKPFIHFYKFYEDALKHGQLFVESACLGTVCENNKSHSRFINIKYINDNFIFYTNYNSPKSKQVEKNNNVSLTFFWNTVNTQIRINGKISKLNNFFNDSHWSKRSNEKKALAISSKQSKNIKSYDEVVDNYKKILISSKMDRPSYWGGYSIKPLSFELWKGHENRLNKRILYKLKHEKWIKEYLQP